MFDLYTSVILITMIFLGITVVDVETNQLITKDTKKKSELTCLLWAGFLCGYAKRVSS